MTYQKNPDPVAGVEPATGYPQVQIRREEPKVIKVGVGPTDHDYKELVANNFMYMTLHYLDGALAASIEADMHPQEFFIEGRFVETYRGPSYLAPPIAASKGGDLMDGRMAVYMGGDYSRLIRNSEEVAHSNMRLFVHATMPTRVQFSYMHNHSLKTVQGYFLPLEDDDGA